VEEFNKGNTSFLMTLYEKDACFASNSGEVVKDLESIRRTLQDFIDMGVKLKARVKRVLKANNLAFLITEWSINGTQPGGKPIDLTGKGTVVVRRQSDGLENTAKYKVSYVVIGPKSFHSTSNAEGIPRLNHSLRLY
jgi:ketosteroid isomerase-like protein